MKKLIEAWKYPFILLFGVGVSNIGSWIYLIALNLMVLEMTKSPLAVAGLYILKPLATLFTNFWAGSITDRVNKRKLMIYLDIVRALFIAILPFFSSIWIMYGIAFLINMASSMFEPASMTYITKLIPVEQRKRFNSLRSLIDSGAFFIGPAIAGILLIIGTPIFAINMNALTFLFSGLVTLFMPNLEKEGLNQVGSEKVTWNLIKNDWKVVLSFSRSSLHVMVIYFLFSLCMVMTAAIDSLEVAFSKEVLHLSDSTYGFLVSIAGVGIVVGAIVNTIFSHKFSTSSLMSYGAMFVSVGYMIYAFSHTFKEAAIGFFVLAFFLAFANTGFFTFFQNSIPVDMMGRVRSIYGLLEAVMTIMITVLMGIAAQVFSIQTSVIVGSFLMVILAICLLFLQKLSFSKEIEKYNNHGMIH